MVVYMMNRLRAIEIGHQKMLETFWVVEFLKVVASNRSIGPLFTGI